MSELTFRESGINVAILCDGERFGTIWSMSENLWLLSLGFELEEYDSLEEAKADALRYHREHPEEFEEE